MEIVSSEASSTWLEESRELHARARRWIDACDRGERESETFDAFALEVMRYQARYVPAVRRLADAAGGAGAIERASAIPPVTTEAFRLLRVAAFPASCVVRRFRTSGTTSGARGTHEFADTGTYDRAAVATARRRLWTTPERPPSRVLVIGPSADEANDSSLTHMNSLICDTWNPAGEGSVESAFLRRGRLEVERFRETVRALAPANGAGLLVLATSFALVEWLDTCDQERTPLPEGSVIMHTGGFKGRTREIAPGELRSALSAHFTLPENAIVSEYGMTELSSQFYDDPLHGGAHGVLLEPPWARVQIVDPETLAPVNDGEIGLVQILDALNIDSAVSILTADLGRRVEGGFELCGRQPAAAARGCSIGIDELLHGSDEAS